LPEVLNKEKSNKKEKKGILFITVNIENNSSSYFPILTEQQQEQQVKFN